MDFIHTRTFTLYTKHDAWPLGGWVSLAGPRDGCDEATSWRRRTVTSLRGRSSLKTKPVVPPGICQKHNSVESLMSSKIWSLEPKPKVELCLTSSGPRWLRLFQFIWGWGLFFFVFLPIFDLCLDYEIESPLLNSSIEFPPKPARNDPVRRSVFTHHWPSDHRGSVFWCVFRWPVCVDDVFTPQRKSRADPNFDIFSPCGPWCEPTVFPVELVYAWLPGNRRVSDWLHLESILFLSLSL